MSDNIAPIAATQGAKTSGGALPESAKEKGALSLFGEQGSADLEVTFAGNGNITPAQVMSRFLQLAGGQLPNLEMLAFANGSPETLAMAGGMSADHALEQNNQQLGIGADDAIAPGQMFQSDLKSALSVLARPENFARLQGVLDPNSPTGAAFQEGGVLTQAPTPPAIGFPSDPRL